MAESMYENLRKKDVRSTFVSAPRLMNLGQSLRKYAPFLATLLIIGLNLISYLYNLTGFLMGGDEGGYLYQAWRFSLGELPYRDFLTPQMPLFLSFGALIYKLFGPSIFAFRLSSVLAMFGAAFFVYLMAREILGEWGAALSLAVFLLYREIFPSARCFRPEPYMMLFIGLALYLLVSSWEEESSRSRIYLLVGAGVAFGLASLTKLFGILALGAYLLGSLYLWWSRMARLREMIYRLLLVGIPFTLIVGAVMFAFYWTSPNFFDCVLEHHLRQGKELTWGQVIAKGITFYEDFFSEKWPLLAFVLLGVADSLWRRDRMRVAFCWPLLTGLAFFAMKRDLFPRYMLYLVPAFSLLFGAWVERWLDVLAPTLLSGNGGWRMGDGEWASCEGKLSSSPSTKGGRLVKSLLSRAAQFFFLACALAVLIYLWKDSRKFINRWENGTLRLVDYIQTLTSKDDVILGDYQEVNFFAQRRSTYLGAGISGGATGSEQITDKALIEEVRRNNVKLLFIHVGSSYSGSPHHLSKMRDYDYFYDYVRSHFNFLGRFNRNGEVHEIYYVGNPPNMGLRWARNFELQDYRVQASAVRAGEEIHVTLQWQVKGKTDVDATVFLHFHDDKDNLWGQGDGALMDSSYFLSSKWEPDEIDRQVYTLLVRPGTPPGQYRISMGLYRPDTGERLPLLNEQGQPIGTEFELGTVQVTEAYRGSIPQVPGTSKVPGTCKDFGPIWLLGFDRSAETLNQGDALHLTLCWQARQDVKEDLRLHLRVGEAEGFFPPAGEAYPTGVWRKGELLCGQYDLLIPAAAQAGPQELFVNLVDGEGKAVRSEGMALDKITIRELERSFALPSISRPMRLEMGEGIFFLGYDLPVTQLRSGQTLPLTLYWTAQRNISTSYTAFVHLLDENSMVRSQRDNIPVGGTRPTTGWAPGEIITDGYELSLPRQLSPGEYRLEIGLYEGRSGERLPVFFPEGPPGDHILLEETIQIANPK